ncbi:hypothetical protein [Corallococcus macrosporus]|uniref:Putative lipoprotein n=1 Tax=Myxococcus fulvus (strain ATCC BAA-855 / HW-1) TaxID=483219 RepID=F8CPK4_MYXFH|nr:hypothetical protein [Corallococcus macrosporus]AEI69144.1 putative lipoprotein [Corallococcus macrosporus]
MKNFYLAVPLALMMSGCVDNPPALQVFNAYIPDESCAVNQSGAASGGGNLDLSTSQRYLAGFAVRSGFTLSEVEVNGSPVSGEGDATAVYVTHIELTYENQGEGPSLESEVYPTHFAVPSSATSNSLLVIDLLGASATQALVTQVGPGSVASYNIRIRLIGKTVTGSEVESNEIAYPVTVYNSGFSCPAGYMLEFNGPCGGPGGQDGYPPTCEEIPT